jgi:hypothetical protein
MIAPQDILVKEGEAVTLANGVKLIGSRPNGSRPNAITIRTENGEINIADFAEMRFSSETAGLVPTCEVAIWKGHAFIAGLPAVVIAGDGVPVKCELFRRGGEDTGFYKTEWLEAGQRLFCIYESGIAAWNQGGQELWHIRKSWDDVFTRADADQLVLIRHDGQRVVIDPTDGSQEPPPNSPPEAPL